jgi:hypothetical protein
LYVAEQSRLHASFSFAQLIRQALADSATRHEALPSGLALADDPTKQIQTDIANSAIFIQFLQFFSTWQNYYLKRAYPASYAEVRILFLWVTRPLTANML